jgi:hypothetical protein
LDKLKLKEKRGDLMLFGELDVLLNDQFYVKIAINYNQSLSKVTIQTITKELPGELCQIILSIKNEDGTFMFIEKITNRCFSSTAHSTHLLSTIDALRNSGIKIQQIF